MTGDWRQVPDSLLRVVLPGEIATVVGDGILATHGIGPSVAVILADRGAPVAGLAHVVLPDGSGHRESDIPGRYADTAVPELRRRLVAQGGVLGRMCAVLVGGAAPLGPEDDVGRENLRAVEAALRVARIPILHQEVGGRLGRTVHFRPATRQISVQVQSARTGVTF